MHGPVASRPGDRRWQRARRAEVSQRHRAVFPAAKSSRPFLARYLKDGAPKADVAAGVCVRNRHQRLAAAHRRGRQVVRAAASIRRSPLYLGAGSEDVVLGAESRRRGIRRIRLRSGQARAVSRASDSADRLRPALTWPQWLVDDQREASGRPDVLAFCLGRA